jgi:tetratricopeptide (TPR) repeat protein
VEGRSLGKLLHGRPLPPDKVAGFGLQVARALVRAHKKGLVHRDIKPANILITAEGDVKVVDFGLAALFAPVADSVGSEDTTHSQLVPTTTTPQRVAGTLPYMSPEQVRGEGADPRSDVYSFGVVLYEMTTGRRPFRAATSADLLAEILKGRPEPVHDLVPEVPLELDRIIQKALSPKPRDRYQTMDDLAVDLRHLERELESGSSPSYEDLAGGLASKRSRRRLLLAAAAVTAFGLAAVAVLQFRSAFGPTPDDRTILILPVEVSGQEEGAEYLGRAFAESLAVQAAQAQELHVLPVPTAGELGESGTLSLASAAQDLGAGRLVTGDLTREDVAVRARLRLLDAAENRILWGTERVSESGDLGELASWLARQLVERLGATSPRLYDYPWNLADTPALQASPVAAEVLGGLSRNDVDAAVSASERLLAEFPEEAGALTLRALALYRRWWHTQTPLDGSALDDALTRLERADPDSPIAGGLRAQRLRRAGRPMEAKIRLEETLKRPDLGPRLRQCVMNWHANITRVLGNVDEAVREFERAIPLDPSNDTSYSDLSLALRDAGRLDEAVQRARQGVALTPHNAFTHASLFLALSTAGRHEEALVPARKACELLATQENCVHHALALLELDKSDEAVDAARKAEALQNTIWGAYNLACFWSLHGDRRLALDWLRRSANLGLATEYVARDPDLALLRGDPEFKAIVEEVEVRIGKR